VDDVERRHRPCVVERGQQIDIRFSLGAQRAVEPNRERRTRPAARSSVS
jgi:hypothetical protein